MPGLPLKRTAHTLLADGKAFFFCRCRLVILGLVPWLVPQSMKHVYFFFKSN